MNKELEDKIISLKDRIKQGEGKLNERLEFIEGCDEGEEKAQYMGGFNQGLGLYEQLCDEYERLSGHPVWCSGISCSLCELKGEGECAGQ